MQKNITSFNIVYEYFGNFFWVALFFASFVYIFINSRPRTRKIFVVSLVLFLIFFINPVILQNLSVSRQKVFYRFFWILPILPMFGYSVIILSKKIKRGIITFTIVGVLVLCGILSGSSFVKKTNFAIPQNRFLLKDEILDMAHVLADYYDDYDRIVVAMPSGIQTKVRLYDTKIVAAIPRKVYLSFQRGDSDNTIKEYLPLIYTTAGKAEYSPEDVKKALEDLNVDAIVVPSCGMVNYMEKCGCSLVANTENYEIYIY